MKETQQQASANRERWQHRLRPVMTRMVVGLAVFFFLASLAQLVYLHNSIRNAPQVDYNTLLETRDQAEALGPRFRSLLILEANLIERRYHQANVFLMSRVWARYLGFVTGMILSLVGAVFILGKLEEAPTEVKTESEKVSLLIRSSSPGLILAVLGVVLMITTIVTHHEIATAESPVYITPGDEKQLPGESDLEAPLPESFP